MQIQKTYLYAIISVTYLGALIGWNYPLVYFVLSVSHLFLATL